MTTPPQGPPPPSVPPAGGPASHPSGLSAEERNWGMAAHLSAFAGAMVALAFVGPLVVWLIRRDQDATGFVSHHAKEALNFNLTLFIAGLIAVALSVATLGLGLIVAVPIGIVIGVLWVVFTIIAAVKAANGEGYRYPATIRLVS